MGVGRDAICSHRSRAPWSLCARFGAVQILDSNRTERYSGQRPSRSLCREPCFRPSHRGYPMAPAQEAAVEPIEEVIQEVLKMLLLCHNTTTAVELTDNQYQVVRREDFTVASPLLELWPAAAQAPLLALSLEVMNRLLNYDSGTTTSSSGSDASSSSGSDGSAGAHPLLPLLEGSDADADGDDDNPVIAALSPDDFRSIRSHLTAPEEAILVESYSGQGSLSCALTRVANGVDWEQSSESSGSK